MCKIAVSIPANLDLDEILTNHSWKIKWFDRDYLLYLFDLLTEIPSNNKDIGDEEGYIPINSKALENVIGREYKKYVQLAIKAGIIECKQQYVVGKRSRGYKFTEQYSGDLKTVSITNYRLVEKINKFRYATKNNSKLQNNWASPELTEIPVYDSKSNGKKKNQEDTPPVPKEESDQWYQPIKNWYESGGLQIDAQLAQDYNSAGYQYKIKDKERWDINHENGKRKNPEIQRRAGERNIQKMAAGNFNPKYNDNNYRLNSTITNCKKELRHALTYKGHKLIAVDISNSQPYLLTILLRKDFWNSDTTEEPTGLLKYWEIPYFRINTIFKTPEEVNKFYIMLCTDIYHNVSKDLKTELIRYNDMVCTGNFYGDFKRLILDVLNVDYPLNDMKPLMFQVLFSDNRFIGQPEAKPKQLFRDLFPEIYKLLNHIKRGHPEVLALSLQRIESYLMFHRIIPRITAEREDLPILSIHDSIVTLCGEEDYVESVMREELERAVGLPPHFKREPLDPDFLRAKIQELKSTDL